jgi:hypothetical protein
MNHIRFVWSLIAKKLPKKNMSYYILEKQLAKKEKRKKL